MSRAAPEAVCSFCGDPATSTCSHRRVDFVIILPGELAAGDVITDPESPGRFFAVRESKWIQEREYFHVQTAQGREFHIPYPDLPILVMRLTECGWPRCEWHCGRCMQFSEREQVREKLIRDYEGAKNAGPGSSLSDSPERKQYPRSIGRSRTRADNKA